MNGEYLYDRYNDGVIVQGYLGKFADIPSEIKGKKVLAAGSAYYNSKSDVINSKSAANANRKFSYIDVKQIIVNGNVEIIKCYAFYGSRNLEYALIGENVNVLENGIFMECTRLKKADVMAEVSKIPAEMFKGCSLLKNVNFGNHIDEIGVSAFEGCANLTEFDFNDVKKMGRRSFYGCLSLHSVKIDNISEIGSLAFAGCSNLSEIEIGKCGILGDNVFKDCNNVSVVRVKSGGVEIGRLLEGMTGKICLEIHYDNRVECAVVPLYKSKYNQCFEGKNFNFDVYDRISAEENNVETAFYRLENGGNISDENKKGYIECIRRNITDAVKMANSIKRLEFLCEKNNIINEENIDDVIDLIAENSELRSYIIDYAKKFRKKKYSL